MVKEGGGKTETVTMLLLKEEKNRSPLARYQIVEKREKCETMRQRAAY